LDITVSTNRHPPLPAQLTLIPAARRPDLGEAVDE
jgi:hypothetical protein